MLVAVGGNLAGKCGAADRHSTALLPLVAVTVVSVAESRSTGALPRPLLPLVGLLVDAAVAGFSFQVARSRR